MALNVTVESYNGRLDCGLIACRRALPDIADLADSLLAEHRKLLELLRPAQAHESPAPVAAAKAAAEPRRSAALKLVAAKKPARVRKPAVAAAQGGVRVSRSTGTPR